MSDQYASIVGFIQFDPQTKDVNGQTVLEATVRAIGFTGQPNVRVTFWSEFSGTFDRLVKGTVVAVDGRYKQGSSADGSKTYHNLSAKSLAILSPVAPAERERTVSNPVAAGSAVAPF